MPRANFTIPKACRNRKPTLRGNRMKLRIRQCLAALTISASIMSSLSLAESPSVAEDIEQLKKDVLEINRDLTVLEEELLFPANTQVAVFVSMDVGELFALDSVELKIDDQIVSTYLYTEKQISALHRGGIQRLWVGNLKTGEHELSAFFVGKGPNKREYRRATSTTFKKGTDTKLIELKIVDSTQKQQPEFKISEWK
jgi:hypothetical protein